MIDPNSMSQMQHMFGQTNGLILLMFILLVFMGLKN